MIMYHVIGFTFNQIEVFREGRREVGIYVAEQRWEEEEGRSLQSREHDEEDVSGGDTTWHVI